MGNISEMMVWDPTTNYIIFCIWENISWENANRATHVILGRKAGTLTSAYYLWK